MSHIIIARNAFIIISFGVSMATIVFNIVFNNVFNNLNNISCTIFGWWSNFKIQRKWLSNSGQTVCWMMNAQVHGVASLVTIGRNNAIKNSCHCHCHWISKWENKQTDKLWNHFLTWMVLFPFYWFRFDFLVNSICFKTIINAFEPVFICPNGSYRNH